MTTTTILRCSKLSYTELINSIYDIDNEGTFSEEQYEKIASEIISKVDELLPGSLMWMPYTSELWADIEDDTDIDEDEFGEILNEAYEYVLRELLF